MHDRRRPMHGSGTAEGENAPCTMVVPIPVERCPPGLGLNGRPTVRQPQLWSLITAIFDEMEPIGLCHEPISQQERLHELLMVRAFVVVGEGRAFGTDADPPIVIG